MTIELGLDDERFAPKAFEDGIHIFGCLGHLGLHTSSHLQVLLAHTNGYLKL